MKLLALPLCEQGFECSDMDSFYSSLTGGHGNQVERAGDTIDLTLAHGRLRVTTHAAPDRLLHRVTTLAPTWIYDLVARWVLPGDFANEGRIGGETVRFGAVLYHQHPVQALQLGGTTLRFLGAPSLPRTLRAEMYLRCEAGRWIVHARAIAHRDVTPFVKHVGGTSQPFHGSRVAQRVLTRRRELCAPIYDTQIQPHVQLPAGTALEVGLAAG
jgi:hypothetical protein